MYLEEKIDKILSLLESLQVSFHVSEDTAAAPSKRGRKAKGEVDGVAVNQNAGIAPAAVGSTPNQTSEPVSAANDDPFAQTPAPVSMDEVRKAILALRDSTDQGTALAILKKHGASNFGEVKPEVTGSIVKDALAAMPAKEADDPFADSAATVPASSTSASAQSVKVTFEDVKKAIVTAQKRTATDTVQKIVMDHGGKAAGAGGAIGPSLKALPADKYALVIDLISKLPTTK